MADPMDPQRSDKRTADRYIKSGLLDEKAYEKFLKTLPDVSDKSVSVETSMDDDFEDEEDDESDEAGAEA